ncbi:MAG: hypothetical protein CVU05_06195 [Bacteroidetes bacterium HGW-Bacteroidetes-21]|jgi:glycosyltransferase involved in cell wall biosynthesis|nr:MAG: hypothetical protein CVU05_06195 [Bacteroidetes bacterium HGW-Bacteroidetes-21]
MQTDKIRILFLIPDFRRGGAERYLTDFCNELIKNNDIEFQIGVLFDLNQFNEETSRFNITYIPYKTFRLFKQNSNFHFQSLLKSFKPHIIHTHLYLAEFLSAYYSDPSISYVCHCHDNMEQFKNFSFFDLFSKKRIYELYEKHFLISRKYKKTNTFFIANSRHTLQYFKQALPSFLENNTKLIYYGFHFNKFKQISPRTISNSRPIKIINVGSFQAKKNQILLLEIAKKLSFLNISFEMNLIGDGELLGFIKSKIKTYKLEDKVFCHGIRNDVEQWYKNSDIYIHPAYYEPFGLVFLEAMASRLPIISLNGKGNADLIQEGKNGYLIQEQKPELFIEKIKLLIDNPDIYSIISNNGYVFSKDFDMSNHLENILGFYKEIISRKRI